MSGSAWKRLFGGGASAKEVFDKTGLFKDADGVWFSIIDDRQSGFTTEGIEAGTEYTLFEVLDHSKLYEAVPDAKNIKVIFTNAAGWGPRGKNVITSVARYRRSTDTITVSAGALRSGGWHAVLLHEVQHALQNRDKTFRNDREGAEQEAVNVEETFLEDFDIPEDVRKALGIPKAVVGDKTRAKAKAKDLEGLRANRRRVEGK